VGNLAGTIIAVASGLILVAVIYVRHELRGPASRPAAVYAVSAARSVRQARTARRAAPGIAASAAARSAKQGRPRPGSGTSWAARLNTVVDDGRAPDHPAPAHDLTRRRTRWPPRS
jgi:hypothetical protein